MHHKGMRGFNFLIKKQKDGSNTNLYMPKKDITWRRTVTGPFWETITGREKESLFQKTPIKTDSNFYIDHNTFKTKNFKTFQMSKQTERGILPTSYDLRIRTEKPFFGSKSLKNINKNKLSDLETLESSKNDKSKTINNKKDNLKINHSLSFAKSLSREKYYFLHRDRRGARPFSNLNYNLVEQRSLSVVSYKNKNITKPIKSRMKGINSNLFYDPDKYIDKLNNHKIINAPNLKIMIGREDRYDKDSIYYPGHMINLYDRNSLEALTKKGLKMNNYKDIDFSDVFSSFCNKKSFNTIINHNLLKDKKSLKNPFIEKINKNLNSANRLKKLMEFYTINLDNQNLLDFNNRFDAITYKTLEKTELLSEKDKKLFSLHFEN